MKISTVLSAYTSAANVDRLKRILCTPFILMYVFLVLFKCILDVFLTICLCVLKDSLYSYLAKMTIFILTATTCKMKTVLPYKHAYMYLNVFNAIAKEVFFLQI